MKLKTFIKFLDGNADIKFISDSQVVACKRKEFDNTLKDHEILEREVIGIDTTTYLNPFSNKRLPCLVIALNERKKQNEENYL